MDEMIKKILFDKLESNSNQNDNIKKLVTSFKEYDPNSLYTGIIIGRLYNSFLYQYRRIVKRNPTNEEFNEFIDFIISNVGESSK